MLKQVDGKNWIKRDMLFSTYELLLYCIKLLPYYVSGCYWNDIDKMVKYCFWMDTECKKASGKPMAILTKWDG